MPPSTIVPLTTVNETPEFPSLQLPSYGLSDGFETFGNGLATRSGNIPVKWRVERFVIQTTSPAATPNPTSP